MRLSGVDEPFHIEAADIASRGSVMQVPMWIGGALLLFAVGSWLYRVNRWIKQSKAETIMTDKL